MEQTTKHNIPAVVPQVGSREGRALSYYYLGMEHAYTTFLMKTNTNFIVILHPYVSKDLQYFV